VRKLPRVPRSLVHSWRPEAAVALEAHESAWQPFLTWTHDASAAHWP
jgi:hypothetical protein